MKTIGLKIITIFGVATLLASCTSVMNTTASKSNTDDLYATHDRKAIAKQEADRETKLAEIREQIALKDIVSAGEDGYYSEDILSDTYEDSYQRRLRGFSSLSYKLPSSYYDFAYSSKAFEVSGYDPSFYNVIVMGDEVWVEPRYVTSMFGNWGRPVNVNINLGFGGRWGWYSPYWDWYTPSWGWSPYYGWGGYPSYGWGYPSYGWGYPHYGWGNPHFGWGGNHGHYPGGGRYDSNVVSGGRRPGMMGSANGSGGGTVSGGGNRVTHTPNGTVITRRNNNGTTPSIGTGTYNPSSGSSNGSSSGATVYRRRNSGTVTEQPTYNGSQDNNNNTNQNIRPNQNQNQNQNTTYQRRSTTTIPSYNSGSSSYGGGNSGSVSGSSGSSSGGGGGSYRRR